MILQVLLSATIAATPAPAKPAPIPWAMLAADATARALDVYSTHRAIEHGSHELFLPNAIAKHPGAMAAYSGAVVFLDYSAARFLEKHHHPKLAKAVIAIDAAQDAFWAIHNLTLKPIRK